ncbi:MAG: DUF2142 domain-containing protein, partial [Actinomycetota bacterium]|nr:DUF2142 domain-containing protein [Actinomycetota bacterium]
MSGARSRLAALPRAALVCAAIAVVNGVCWAAITPTFWVPDEVSHVGFAQHVAETGRLPSIPAGGASEIPGPSEEQNFLSQGLPFSVEGRPSWSPARDREFKMALERGRFDRSRLGQGLAANVHPPLYYLVQAVPYRLTRDRSLLDRVMAMRLLSALLAGVTVFFTFLFLRELLPRSPWAWTVGGLVTAFQPLLGFLAGGVNNDNLTFAASAALFYGIARGFHRGLGAREGAFIGLAVAAGALTKGSIVGLLPGVAFALAALLWRASPSARRPTLLAVGIAVAAAALPWAVWVVYARYAVGVNPAPAAGLASGSATSGLDALREQASYTWQAFLPRLPFMADQFPYYLPWEAYFKGFIGRFGWFEFGFPDAWYRVAGALFVPIVALAGVALARARRSLKGRWTEVATYALMVGGLAFALEIVAYRYHEVVNQSAFFEQARYLFPLLPLYAALIALAVKG